MENMTRKKMMEIIIDNETNGANSDNGIKGAIEKLPKKHQQGFKEYLKETYGEYLKFENIMKKW